MSNELSVQSYDHDYKKTKKQKETMAIVATFELFTVLFDIKGFLNGTTLNTFSFSLVSHIIVSRPK